MFDLPSVNPDLEKLKREIVELRRGKRGGHYRPHKLVMLLAVIELAERGQLNENKIFLAHPLIEAFENIFVLIKSEDDLCQVGPPFFHLRTSGFWFHQVRSGREYQYAKLTTTGGGLQIIEQNIEYAYLRGDVYALVTDPMSRKDLRLFISDMLNIGRD